jgi:hypothetical protein
MSRTRKGICIILGTVCIALGAIGVVVPGLPTTVFVIAASWFYSKSSPALDRRLRRTRWLGEALRRFEESRAMSARAKAIAIGSMWLGIAFGVTATISLHPALPTAMVASALVGSGVILIYVRTARSAATAPVAPPAAAAGR